MRAHSLALAAWLALASARRSCTLSPIEGLWESYKRDHSFSERILFTQADESSVRSWGSNTGMTEFTFEDGMLTATSGGVPSGWVGRLDGDIIWWNQDGAFTRRTDPQRP